MGIVCVVGSINLDLLVEVERNPEVGETVMGKLVGQFPGGKGLNQAVAAARCGAATRFCGLVGDDANGAYLKTAAAEAGVEVTHIGMSDELPTGFAHVALLPGSANSIIVAAGANQALGLEAAKAATVGADVVLAQLEVPVLAVEAAMAAGRAAGATTILNAAPAAGARGANLENVDILIVNESEAAELGGIDAILRAGPLSVVVTLGSRGSVWGDRVGRRLEVASFRVDAVDTTGAGDAFCGALAAKLSAGLTIEDALIWASAAGAIVATQVGAQTPALSPMALDRMVVSV